MVQNTNAEAFLRLKPLESNIGGIVEEHIRYWKKTKDAEEAGRLARKAKEADFLRKKQKDQSDFIMKNLGLEDSSAYFRQQIVSDYERRKPQIAELSKRALQGDTDAILRLDTIKQEFKELVTLDKASGEAVKKFIDSSDKKNPLLDKNKELFVNNVTHGNYRILNGKIELLDEKGLSVSTFSSQQMRDKLNSLGEYSGKFEPKKLGSGIADTIKLDDSNGNRKIDEIVLREAVQKTKNAFAQDSVASQSWAVSKGYTLDEFQKLDEVKLNELAIQFAREEVVPKFQQVNNGLANASKVANLERTRRANKKAKREEDLLFAKATDEQGNDLKVDLGKIESDKFNQELAKGGRSFTINNGKYKVGGESSTITQEVVGGISNDNDEITLVVKRIEEVPIVEVPKELKLGSQYKVKTSDGKSAVLKLKSVNGEELVFHDPIDKERNKTNKPTVKSRKDLLPIDTGKKDKVVKTRLVKDKDELNAISSDLGLGNLSTLFSEAQKALGEKPKKTTKAEGDSIFDN